MIPKIVKEKGKKMRLEIKTKGVAVEKIVNGNEETDAAFLSKTRIRSLETLLQFKTFG